MNITIDQMIQFVEAVEQFYNSAWTKLVAVGAVIIGAGAIGIPILIQWWQKRKIDCIA